MLTLHAAGGESLWDEVLPEEVRALPDDLAWLDELLSDPAVLALIAQLLMIPAYPFWSLAIFTLDILAIYGLIAYGKKISTLEF